jgi:hypothetical protein
MISTIFGRVSEVFLWIGEEREDSRWLFQTLAKLKKSVWDRFPYHGLGPHDRIFLALSRLFDRSYWTRLWIIQEVLSASSLRLWRGSKSLAWEGFQSAFNPPAHLQPWSRPLFNGPGALVTQQYYSLSINKPQISIWIRAGPLAQVVHCLRVRVQRHPGPHIWSHQHFERCETGQYYR